MTLMLENLSRDIHLLPTYFSHTYKVSTYNESRLTPILPSRVRFLRIQIRKFVIQALNEDFIGGIDLSLIHPIRVFVHS